MIEHKSVLLKESIKGLNLKKGDTVVDATLGGGGHSLAILKIIGESGKLIAIDLDNAAVDRFRSKVEPCLPAGRSLKSKSNGIFQSEAGNVYLVRDNFSNIKNVLGGMDVLAVHGILADLGYSSIQLENENYGMSFLKDAELDMRLDRSQELSAKRIVNEYSQEDLAKIISEYGEEKFAKNIAKKIVERRKNKPIERTLELAEIIKQAIPKKFQKSGQHPATKTFQALRIGVNQELENLKKFVTQAIEALEPGGRLAIITFHSLEDRIVKNIFRENARGCICPSDFPKCLCGHKAKVKLITRKPIVPNGQEILENPRARSAKLRVCERV